MATNDVADLWREPVLPRSLWETPAADPSDPSLAGRSPRCRLFRIPSAFAGDPVRLDTESTAPADETSLETLAGADRDPTGGRVQVLMGLDNPNFDFRVRGDPGGVGFYKLHSQVLLLDTGTTGLSMGLQAVTPAGLEADGMAGGPTVLSPNFGWFCQLSDAAALQGFVGKSVRAAGGWSDSLERDIQYGLALHGPIPGFDDPTGHTVQLFIEALGRYRPEADAGGRPPEMLDLLPGIHWRMGDSWWLSGGVLMPLGTSRLDTRFWQITCSWQF